MPNVTKDMQIDSILIGIAAHNPKTAYRALADKICDQLPLTPAGLTQRLEEQEKRISSAIGDGIAVCHYRLPHLNRPYITLARLKQPVPFAAADSQNVDILCLLLTPLQEAPLHLPKLAKISRWLRNPETQRIIRESPTVDAIRLQLLTPEGWMLAA